MKESNVDAVYTEHPFLEKLFPRARTQRAVVQRWDDELLTMSAHSDDSVITDKIYLLDEHGNVVTRVGEYLRFFTRDETVGQALNRIGNESRRVRYAVYPRSALMFYKLPRGYKNAADWLNSKVVEGRKQIR